MMNFHLERRFIITFHLAGKKTRGNLANQRSQTDSPSNFRENCLSQRSRNVLTLNAIELSAKGDSWLDDTVSFA